MKKLYLFLLMILPLALLPACSDDDDIAQVDINVALKGVTDVNGVYYVVNGTPVQIESITATPTNGASTALYGVDYYLNYHLIGYSIVAPFSADVNITKPGMNIMQIYTTVFQVDKTVTNAYVEIPFMLVESSDDIPGYSGGDNTVTFSRRVAYATPDK